MLKMDRISRKNLVDIAKTSEVSDNSEIELFIEKMENLGLYTYATDDDIEEYDDLYDSLIGE